MNRCDCCIVRQEMDVEEWRNAYLGLRCYTMDTIDQVTQGWRCVCKEFCGWDWDLFKYHKLGVGSLEVPSLPLSIYSEGWRATNTKVHAIDLLTWAAFVQRQAMIFWRLHENAFSNERKVRKYRQKIHLEKHRNVHPGGLQLTINAIFEHWINHGYP